MQAVEQAGSIEDIPPGTRESLRAFSAVLHDARRLIHAERPLLDVAKHVAQAIRLKEDIVAAGPTPIAAGKRWTNVEMLYRTLEKSGAATPGEASAVLTRLTLHFAEEDDESGEIGRAHV